MKTAFLVLTLSLMSITSFASDLTCFGKLDEEVIKLSVRPNDQNQTVNVSLKVREDNYKGNGIVIVNEGFEVIAIVKADGDNHRLKLNLPASLLKEQSAFGSLSLSVGSKVLRSKVTCAKSN